MLLAHRGISKVPTIASDKELAKLEALRKSNVRNNRQSRSSEEKSSMDPKKARYGILMDL